MYEASLFEGPWFMIQLTVPWRNDRNLFGIIKESIICMNRLHNAHTMLFGCAAQ
jgi:hypothetical protein